MNTHQKKRERSARKKNKKNIWEKKTTFKMVVVLLWLSVHRYPSICLSFLHLSTPINEILQHHLFYFSFETKKMVIALILLLSICAAQLYALTMPKMLRSRTSTAVNCIGTEMNPLPRPQIVRTDRDNSWRTAPGSTIIPVKREQFTNRPELITFDAYNTLIEPSQSMGRWYREALNTATEMTIRLPRPALFTAAFKKAYDDMCISHPCFGTLTNGQMTPKQWWYEVVRNTYRGTQDLNTLDEGEIDSLMPTVFPMLYDEIFSTSKGWLVKEDVEYTLIKLKEWRDQGSGPKIGVISNSDNRLKTVLKGNLKFYQLTILYLVTFRTYD